MTVPGSIGGVGGPNPTNGVLLLLLRRLPSIEPTLVAWRSEGIVLSGAAMGIVRNLERNPAPEQRAELRTVYSDAELIDLESRVLKKQKPSLNAAYPPLDPAKPWNSRRSPGGNPAFQKLNPCRRYGDPT